MTKPALINHNETVDASTTSYLIESHAHRISFMNVSEDWIYNDSPNDTISLSLSVQNTILDETHGMHIKLDPFSLLTTVIGFQNDPQARIDLTTSMFSSKAAIANSLHVVPGYGTELAAELHGPMVMMFPGDYDVKLSQFHFVRT